jgi:hypothetical protein
MDKKTGSILLNESPFEPFIEHYPELDTVASNENFTDIVMMRNFLQWKAWQDMAEITRMCCLKSKLRRDRKFKKATQPELGKYAIKREIQNVNG